MTCYYMWFEIINAKANHAIYSMSDSRILKLKSFIEFLLDWKKDVKENHRGENKRLMASPTLIGLIFTTRNFIALVQRLLKTNRYICPGSFTQEPLEALFGNIREMGRRMQDPDIHQFGYSVAHYTQRKVIKKIKGGNTTFGTKNMWTTVCDAKTPKGKRGIFFSFPFFSCRSFL
uniref:uncharacterized protein LOC108951036 n=1 Tax=Ciona intestinalis TaxID=7719 RepID=UPI00089DAA86|nr:uncharacterized protein LOC108951036 [Ciona intestinalis]|eukprot:XP_018673141.1 uncharacterized protein LOC108951036 [Ciona intestinalis]